MIHAISKESSIESEIAIFKETNGFSGVGSMGTALILTRKALQNGLPIDLSKLTTAGGGQVAGLSGNNINKILNEHGLQQRVGTEAGRTSRGTPALAKIYAQRLNDLNPTPDDLMKIESWWVGQFVIFFQ